MTAGLFYVDTDIWYEHEGFLPFGWSGVRRTILLTRTDKENDVENKFKNYICQLHNGAVQSGG